MNKTRIYFLERIQQTKAGGHKIRKTPKMIQPLGKKGLAKVIAGVSASFGAYYLMHIGWMSYSRKREMELLEVAKKQIAEEYPELSPYVNLGKDDFDEYTEHYKKIIKH